jgi:glutamate racemase
VTRVRVALVNSGVGLIGAAAALRRLDPDCDVVLSMDPEGMPWGPRSPESILDRTWRCTRAALELDPDVVVLACNTASVHALGPLRAELEPAIPVIGTVPAVKPASLAGGLVAVWGTPATTGSGYL